MKSISLIGGLLSIASIAYAGPAGSAGCGKPLPKAQGKGGDYPTNFTTSDGTARKYIIHIPSNYDQDKPVPVIFSFHGRTKTAEEQQGLSQFSNEDWNPDAIAVYPQGLDKQWQGDPKSKGVDDIAFTMEMLDHFEDRYCVDSSRIYAAGKSNGGGFTNLLACDAKASTRIAAFAPVSGAYYQEVPEGGCNAQTVPIACNPGRKPIPVLEFHGTADKTIPYDGGDRRDRCLPAVPHFVREWSKRDGFGLHNKTTPSHDGNVHEYQYGSDDSLGTVTHYRIEGLGHAWPSTKPNDDNSAGTYLNATPIIMDFFKRWTLE
ncbi:hypothetical protein ASPWEDRAFT_42377 [Aspergillus wentii DTO 134E9]|uniref:feruloyl esterase n=1 Tax=Aspergillus wentii DTO 134E9 TaxID=1073089 RepID=A0A1L9RHR5_ASPWE|nr:uncharacterized protein ASPWEDRAFT_42377 [Aspergillus wentii DTO 134E9]KAI9925719.1 hypothetical protein MW887_005521 [Aspergillus wentii]OJJ34383.1 hypothetical protein ASPWEDRAFT_42377 [Aspergillus wentii DTO 134E9]